MKLQLPYADGKIISSVVGQQTIHEKFGGVVPEIASREHEILLNHIVDKAIIDAKIKLSQIEAISITQGPGLAGTLLTGISFAKGLGFGLEHPCYSCKSFGRSYICKLFSRQNLRFSFYLFVSVWWAYSNMVNKGYGKLCLLRETRDDAAGEAFDKGARILGLGYPGRARN